MSQYLLLAILAVFVSVRIAHTMRDEDDPNLALILIVAAAARIVVGIVNHHYGPLPGARIDAVMFDQTAQNMALVDPVATSFIVEFARGGYASLLAVFFRIAGHHYLIATLVNLVFTIEFLILVYRMGQKWGGQSVARLATACVAFYPTSILYTSVSLREAPLLWGLALYVRALVDYFEGERPLLQGRLLFALAFLVWLHDGFALAIFLVPVAMWFKYDDVSIGRRLSYLSLGVVAMLIAFVLAVTFFEFRKMPDDPAQLLDPAFLSRMRETKSAYGIGYGHVDATWGGIVAAVPLLTFAFVAAPFPIWWEDLSDLPKLIEGLLSLTLVVGACVAVYTKLGKPGDRGRRMFLAMFLYLVFVFAMGTGNTGIAARHRAKMLWMPILINAVVFAPAWIGWDEPGTDSGA